MSDICSTEFLENWLAARPAGAVVSHGRLPLGEQVGEWRVEAYLGAGISAEVYRVVNTRTGRDGALKLLVDQSKGLGARFTEEMDAMRFLHLSCLPTFYGNGTFRGRPYFVMEYLQPLLLPLPPAEVPAFIVSVAESVQSLHEMGFVHRDLKPGNVLRRRDGTPVLIDLGLIKKVDGHEGEVMPPSPLSLVDGRPVGVGTIDYAAPEQLLKGEASVRGDVFSLGKLLRECFPEKPSHAWRVVIRRATQEAPEDRYQTAAEFARAVRWRNLPYGLAVAASALLAALLLVVPLPVVRPISPASANDFGHVNELPPSAEPIPISQQPDESSEEHLARLLPLAENENVAAQLLVAEAYFYGRGTETNHEQAVAWYRRAAAHEVASAQASLGLCAFHGWGCGKDYDEAVDWYLKAAAGGNLAAMSDLAYCYMHGFGVVKEPEEGFRWALKAAERGHPAAQVMVAECYLDGRGTETNSVRAEVWLQSAARQGNKRALKLLEGR